MKKPPSAKLLPNSETGKRFVRWFNHAWDFITATTPQPGEKPQWTTCSDYPLSPRQIWNARQDRGKLIGLRFGSFTNYLVLDIDRNSPYHPQNNLALFNTLLEVLEAIGLCRPVIIQSSYSEGLHIYYFLPKPVKTYSAACLLKLTLIDAGFAIEKGKLEIFPNVKRYAKTGEKPSLYNGHRLPLQPNTGSYLLDEDLNIFSGSIEDFLEQADHSAANQDIETFTLQLETAPERLKKLKKGRFNSQTPSQKALIWKQDLERIVSQGWTGHGQTNDLIAKFVCYAIVFLGLKSRELRQSVKKMLLNAPGYEQYCRHQHEIDKRIEDWCTATETNRYYLEYANQPDRDKTFISTFSHLLDQSGTNNNQGERETTVAQSPVKCPFPQKRSQQAAERIVLTVAYLEKEGKLPKQVAQRRDTIIKTAKQLFGVSTSVNTLNKRSYLFLWHPGKRNENNPSSPSPTQESDSATEIQLNPIDEAQERKIQPVETVEPLLEEKLTTSSAECAPTPDLSDLSNLLSEAELTTLPPIYEVFETTDADRQKNLTKTTTTNQTNFSTSDGDEVTICNEDKLHSDNSASTSTKRARERLNLDWGKFFKTLRRQQNSGFQKAQPVETGATVPEAQSSLEEHFTHEEAIETSRSKPDGIDEVIADSSVRRRKNDDPDAKLELDREVNPERKALLQKFSDNGVTLNSTLIGLIMSQPIEAVENALAAMLERCRNELIKNPAGFLVKAIKNQWKPREKNLNQAAATERSKLPDGFLEWYERARTSGIVEDIPVSWLPLYQNHEPMVRVNQPSFGGAPYTLMRFSLAKAQFGDGQ